MQSTKFSRCKAAVLLRCAVRPLSLAVAESSSRCFARHCCRLLSTDPAANAPLCASLSVWCSPACCWWGRWAPLSPLSVYPSLWALQEQTGFAQLKNEGRSHRRCPVVPHLHSARLWSVPVPCRSLSRSLSRPPAAGCR